MAKKSKKACVNKQLSKVDDLASYGNTEELMVGHYDAELTNYVQANKKYEKGYLAPFAENDEYAYWMVNMNAGGVVEGSKINHKIFSFNKSDISLAKGMAEGKKPITIFYKKGKDGWEIYEGNGIKSVWKKSELKKAGQYKYSGSGYVNTVSKKKVIKKTTAPSVAHKVEKIKLPARKVGKTTSGKYKTYMTKKEQSSFVKKNKSFAQWSENLSGDELNALIDYTGQDYVKINSSLRRGKVPKKYNNTINSLNNAISKNVVPENMTVFRGMASTKKMDFGYKVGSIVEDKGFVSTDMDVITASEFAFPDAGYSGKFKSRTIFEIKIPKGSNAGFINEATMGEQEVLLPTGSRFKVVSKEKADMNSILGAIKPQLAGINPDRSTVDLITMELVP